ncbi:MAG: 50S ribosomal protein L11 methyltransferase [Rhodobacteraceae bacterium]|nr:MAG: 50S ribosomal protein L11 methyltransferase [Paracoccaceae bacterium]
MSATFTAMTTLTGKREAEALGEALERLDPEPQGVGVFEIEDGSGRWEIGAYFTEAPDETGLALLAAAFGANPFLVSELPETDWVAKVRRDLAPVQAGRFFVYGSHDADKVPRDAVPLLIDASMAFGTGHHGTTKGCLIALDRLAAQGFVPARVADIGCGTAVLAMAAARLFPARIIASDIDAVAVEVALANLAANGLSGRIDCIEAAGFDHPALTADAPYDLIFANILKGPLIALAPDLARHAAPGGFAILSGILNEQAEAVQKVYVAEGYNPVASDRIGDWTTLVLQKMA